MTSAIARNIFYLFQQNLLRLFVGLGVGIWMARYLGAELYGQFNYILSFAFVFHPILSFGLEEIVVKKIKEYPLRVNEILGSAALIRTFAAFIFSILVVFFICLQNIPFDVATLVLLYSSFLLFRPFDVIESYYYAELDLKKVTRIKNILFILVSCIKALLIIKQSTLIYFVLLSGIEVLMVGLGNLLIYSLSDRLSLSSWRTDKALMKEMFHESYPIMFNVLIFSALAKVDQLFIANLASFNDLGAYSAAAKLIDVWQFAPLILSGVFFTKIAESRGDRDEERWLMLYFSSMLWLSLLLVLGVALLGNMVIDFAYGSKFSYAKSFMLLYSVQFIFFFYSQARTKYFANLNSSSINVLVSSIALGVNCILNYFFIRWLGAIGAIYASIIAYLFAVATVCLFSHSLLKMTLLYCRSLLSPFKKGFFSYKK